MRKIQVAVFVVFSMIAILYVTNEISKSEKQNKNAESAVNNYLKTIKIK